MLEHNYETTMPSYDDQMAQWEQFKREHPPGTRLRGTVKHVMPFGVFLDLGIPFSALLEIPQFAKSLPLTDADYPTKGQSLDVMIHSYGHERPGGGPGQINLTQKSLR